MPPKAKFTREEIIDAAFEMVRRDGFEILTARSLGAKLKSSARPIFTVFKSMEEVQAEVMKRAKRLYEKYEDEGMSGANAFKGSGTGYIRFASDEPKLFQLLFMKEKSDVPSPEKVLEQIDDYNEKILETVEKQYGLNREAAARVYLHLWLYSHGIAVAIATKICTFTQEQIDRMLAEVGAGIIGKIKREESK
ncbi:MAG: TetR/AcrR family transcriptional regulator [Clostridia bacterium]|nr:TetR/AcrR family transcriptional regulator [Clostridia bacterium]